MAKLYATLETSRGKVVSISDNEKIIATVYDGNLKAYSVIIEWCNVGDHEHIKCNNCGWEGNEEELTIVLDTESCPQCKKEGYLMDTEPTMGAIVTAEEWRNRPEDRRKGKKQKGENYYKGSAREADDEAFDLAQNS